MEALSKSAKLQTQINRYIFLRKKKANETIQQIAAK